MLNVAEEVDDSGNGIIVHITIELNTACDSAMTKEVYGVAPGQ